MSATYNTPWARLTPGNTSSFENIDIFDPADEFRRDISGDTVDPNSDAYLAWMSTGGAQGANTSAPSNLTMNFGTGVGGPFGLAYSVVDDLDPQPLVPVSLWDQTIWSNDVTADYPPAYPLDTDPNTDVGDVFGFPPFNYPIPPWADVETGTDHLLTVFGLSGRYYELFKPNQNDNPRWVVTANKQPIPYPGPFWKPTNDNGWTCSNAAIWNANLVGGPNNYRGLFFTAAGASGMPYFPLTIRYDEVFFQKEIRHAIHFTVNNIRALNKLVFPARHQAGQTDQLYPPVTGDPSKKLPFGARLRLKASFDISPYTAGQQIILTALKKYGMILGDNSSGNGTQLVGSKDPRWGPLAGTWTLSPAINLPGNFEVVTLGDNYYTFTGPTAGAMNTTSAPFTVAWTAKAGTIAVNKPCSMVQSADQGLGHFTPVSPALDNTNRSKTFTVTPATNFTGTMKISITNNRNLFDAPSINYVVS